MKVLKKIMLIFAAGALFAACSEELETVDPNGSFDEGITIPPTTLSLSVPAMGQPSVSLIPASTRGEGEEAVSLSLGEVGTRAGDTSATDAECAVKNLWILQFDGNGKLVVKQKFSESDVKITSTNLQATLAVPLKGYDACTLYAIANMGDTKFDSASTDPNKAYTLAELEKAIEIPATLVKDINTTGLPMAASWTGQTKDPSAYTETTAPKFEMKRMVAKVSFTCKVACEVSGHSFSLESIQLRSVPSTTTYKVGVTGTPATTATFVDYAIESSATTDKPYVWYMPENLRGEGGNTGGLATGKGESTAPTRSTYVEVKGKYSTGSETSDVTFRIFPGANETNDFNIKRNCKYTMTATIVGISETDSRVIIAVDLCKNPWLTGDQTETANCYMVSKAGCTYKFNARVMGNGKETAKCSITANNAPAITPVPLDPKSVKVLWETSGANKIIKSVELKSDGWVYFTTAGESGGTLTEGNAVIAVYSSTTAGSNTDVLWSWHIWSTSYAPTKDNESTALDTYSTRTSNTYKMMQRNLGASNNKDGDLGSYGLLYQWGRKDPFIGANGTSSTTPATTYGLSWPTAVAASSTTSGTGATNRDKSIDYAIKHPMTFITQAATTYDWLNATAIADQRDNLWGNPNTSTSTPTVTTVNKNMTKKSIYDPCPPGFSVPPQDAWTYFTTSGNNVTSGAPSGCNVDTSYGFKLGWKFYYQTGKSVYYPAAGYRHRESGALALVGTEGVYWSSSSYYAGSYYAGYLGFRSSLVYPLNSNYRAYGFSVRCVQNNQ